MCANRFSRLSLTSMVRWSLCALFKAQQIENNRLKPIPLSPATERELGAPNLSGGVTHPSPHRVGAKPRGLRRSGCEKARAGSDTAAGGLGGQASPPSPAAPNYRPGERAERPAEAATRRGAAAAGTTASDNPPRKASQDARTSAGKQRA